MYIANLKDCHWDKEGSSAVAADSYAAKEFLTMQRSSRFAHKTV